MTATSSLQATVKNKQNDLTPKINPYMAVQVCPGSSSDRFSKLSPYRSGPGSDGVWVLCCMSSPLYLSPAFPVSLYCDYLIK